jgi:hypothetical protein
VSYPKVPHGKTLRVVTAFLKKIKVCLGPAYFGETNCLVPKKTFLPMLKNRREKGAFKKNEEKLPFLKTPF